MAEVMRMDIFRNNETKERCGMEDAVTMIEKLIKENIRNKLIRRVSAGKLVRSGQDELTIIKLKMSERKTSSSTLSRGERCVRIIASLI